MNGLRGATLALRFGCELTMLAALAYAAFQLGGRTWAWVLGLAAPVLAAAVWGVFVAPKSRHRAPGTLRVAIEVLLFGAAVTGLALTGHRWLAASLGVVALATSLLNESQERQLGLPGSPVN